jgi:hypothetical protein
MSTFVATLNCFDRLLPTRTATPPTSRRTPTQILRLRGLLKLARAAIMLPHLHAGDQHGSPPPPAPPIAESAPAPKPKIAAIVAAAGSQFGMPPAELTGRRRRRGYYRPVAANVILYLVRSLTGGNNLSHDRHRAGHWRDHNAQTRLPRDPAPARRRSRAGAADRRDRNRAWCGPCLPRLCRSIAAATICKPSLSAR